MQLSKRLLKMHPAAMVFASYILAIAMGTLLLKLPLAVREDILSWTDAFFTATSAVCVTGLVVVDTGSYFTVFGQCVILGMIQIGGLGVMTISVAMFRGIGRIVSFRQRMAMQDLFAHTPREDILGLVRSILFFTAGAEIVGAIALTFHWYADLGLAGALYAGVFHSISAFCNAGFALFSDSMTAYSGSILLNAVIGLLIVTGGIGFPVLYDLQGRICNPKQHRRLSVQTKTVLLLTLILIVGGALMFAALEHRTLSASSSLAQRILVPLFQSITCRTAGFNTVDIGSLREATLAVMIFLMFFGASPGSCGGGVKTTTLALLIAFTATRVRRRQRVNIFKKTVPSETVTRAFSLVLVSIGIICAVLFMLLVADRTPAGNGGSHSFLAYLFETVSAFGTVGLSMGVTPVLSEWGKYWIILMMIVGRVGVLTFAYIVVGTGTSEGIVHAEENVMIG
jgi:trk system potassium uptake protein